MKEVQLIESVAPPAGLRSMSKGRTPRSYSGKDPFVQTNYI